MSICKAILRKQFVGPLLVAVFFLTGCGGEGGPDPKVRSHLTGQVTVSSVIDSSGDYSGFRVLVAQGRGRAVDTLAHTRTGRDGRFAVDVVADERGIYPLLVFGRAGQRQQLVTEFVVADGDTAELNVELPIRRQVRIRSAENSALIAYRNTMALHRQRLVQNLEESGYGSQAVVQSVRQTSSMLWGLRDTYPDTYAAGVSEVQSLALLEGWNDSLVVARARQVEPTNPRYVEAARIARRAEARRNGVSAATSLIDDFRARATSDVQRAELQAALVRTYADSLMSEEALAAAAELRETYPDTDWAAWADRASYEIETLMPGMPAPDFTLRTLDGDTLSLAGMKGRPVLLEFYQPGNELFVQQIPTRNALYEVTRPDSVAFVSVSVQPDSALTQAFFDGRSLPGRHAIAPGGEDDTIVSTYNVGAVPTRYLIDADGNIVEKYVGSAFFALQDDLLTLVGLTREDAGLLPMRPSS